MAERGPGWFGRRRQPRRAEPTPEAREFIEWFELTAREAVQGPTTPTETDPSEPAPNAPPPDPTPPAPASATTTSPAPSPATGPQAWGTPEEPEEGLAPKRAAASSASPSSSKPPTKPVPPTRPVRPANKPRPKPKVSKLPWIAAAVVAGGAVAWGVSNAGPPGPSVPRAPAGRAGVVEITPTWAATTAGLMRGPVQGATYDGSPFVAADSALVFRYGSDHREHASGLHALALSGGSTLWQLEFQDAVCAAEPLATLAGELVICAGQRADGWRLLYLDPATGEALRDVALPGPVATIGTATSGVAVREPVGVAASGGPAGSAPTVSVRWYDADGTELWSGDAVALEPEIAEELDRLAEPGSVPELRTSWTRFGDALLLNLDGYALVLDSDGAQAPTGAFDRAPGCWVMAVPDDRTFACAGLWTVGVQQDPVTGAWAEAWRSDLDLVGGSPVAPVLLGMEYVDNNRAVYRMDPETGAQIEELTRFTSSSPRTLGPAENPLLTAHSELVGLAPGATETRWRRTVDRSFGSSGWFVTGDRMVWQDYNGGGSTDVVIDAETGAEVARLKQGQLFPLEGGAAGDAIAMRADRVELLRVP